MRDRLTIAGWVVIVIGLMCIAGVAGWQGSKNYYRSVAPKPVMARLADGSIVPVWYDKPMRLSRSHDQGEKGAIGTDKSTHVAKAADVVTDSDLKAEMMSTAPQQALSKSTSGATKAAQIGSDFQFEWERDARPFMVIACTIAGIALILGAVVAFIWLKMPLSTCLIIGGVGIGLIVFARLAEDPMMMYIGIAVASAIGLAAWFILGRKGLGNKLTVEALVPMIDSFKRITFLKDVELEDRRWDEPEVDKIKAGTTLFQYVKAQAKQKIRGEDKALIDATIDAVKPPDPAG